MMNTSYSIGEFSQITGLSAKTLRFYHEKGILVPSSVDEATGYRFYDANKVEKARTSDSREERLSERISKQLHYLSACRSLPARPWCAQYDGHWFCNNR